MPDSQDLSAPFDPDSDPQAWLDSFRQSLDDLNYGIYPAAAARQNGTPGLLGDLATIRQAAESSGGDTGQTAGPFTAAANASSAQPNAGESQPTSPNAGLATSPQGRAVIRSFEAPGGKAAPIRGSIEGGGQTGGFGHKFQPGQSQNGFEPDQAFVGDIHSAENLVKRQVRVPLNQNQFDAMVSFAMNNPAAFTNDQTFMSALNVGNFPAAMNAMLQHDAYRKQDANGHPVSDPIPLAGLERRRFHEADMFSNGRYLPF